jgi:hypothetical protein
MEVEDANARGAVSQGIFRFHSHDREENVPSLTGLNGVKEPLSVIAVSSKQPLASHDRKGCFWFVARNDEPGSRAESAVPLIMSVAILSC